MMLYFSALSFRNLKQLEVLRDQRFQEMSVFTVQRVEEFVNCAHKECEGFMVSVPQTLIHSRQPKPRAPAVTGDFLFLLSRSTCFMKGANVRGSSHRLAA